MEVFMRGEDHAAMRQHGYPRGDLDFGDVFGGPPRRFFKVVAKEVVEVRSKLREKPVFGGKSVARRPRHFLGDDFFDDIFRGGESSWRTRQPFSSLTTRYSFPIKLPKVADFHEMMDGGSKGLSSPYSSTSSFSRNSNETSRDELRNETVHQIFSDENKVEKVEKDERSIRNSYDFIANMKGEFARIFKEGGDAKTKIDVKKQSQSCRWTMENDKVDEDYTSKKTLYSSESLRWDSKILEEDLESDYSFEDFIVELSDDPEQNVAPQLDVSRETKDLDAKIGQWSAGKKGNIRSLLSTLQFVLWPGNEWKAIALVDLVEANPVKRAYQKALLHLHPDKLQQKGAASNHKYIAEKVFDILQEAWDHFNNVALV